jgi:hypothetical protein
VAALAVGGIAWFAMSMDGPVEPANKASVVKARKNYLRLARTYRSGYRHYEGRKRWARQMNRTCHVFNRRMRVWDTRLGKVGRIRSARALLWDAERQIRTALDRMRRLRPPPEDRTRVRRMFASYDHALSLMVPLFDALVARDVRTAQRIGAELERSATRANRTATALGAAVCTRD